MNKKKLILISGIPGMGKTTIGNFFQNNYTYKHFDLEDPKTSEKLHQNTNLFIDSLSEDNKVVATWGFQPYWHYQHIIRFKKNGFKLIWFDGNRIAAYREYMRIKRDQNAFYQQLNNISNSRVIDLLQPNIINTFDDNGNFRNKAKIVEEIEVLLV